MGQENQLGLVPRIIRSHQPIRVQEGSHQLTQPGWRALQVPVCITCTFRV